MNKIRRKKIIRIFVISCGVIISLSLILYALRSNINAFYVPEQIINNPPTPDQVVKVGGFVAEGSVQKDIDNLLIKFDIDYKKHSMKIHYKGILPDLFREGQSILAIGNWNSQKKYFVAKQILAKHDEVYKPPELKA